MTADKKLWRNRKERKQWARRLQSEDPVLEVIHPRAAGIDVGNSAHYVAVRPERDPPGGYPGNFLFWPKTRLLANLEQTINAHYVFATS